MSCVAKKFLKMVDPTGLHKPRRRGGRSEPYEELPPFTLENVREFVAWSYGIGPVVALQVSDWVYTCVRASQKVVSELQGAWRRCGLAEDGERLNSSCLFRKLSHHTRRRSKMNTPPFKLIRHKSYHAFKSSIAKRKK